jgi:transposase
METKYFGVDTSKAKLDVGSDGRVVVIENSTKTIRAFARRMPAGSYVAIEATNTYHLQMADICHSYGMHVFVINPRLTRRYREANGLRGHNDRMDALTLARYIEREHEGLREYVPLNADQRRLRSLVRRRWKLVGVRTKLVESFGGMKELKSEFKALVDRLDTLIAKLEGLIDKQLEGNAGRACIASIKGVGPVVSAVLVADLDAYQFSSADAFVAYYGLDPTPNDSGQRRGQRKLSKHGQRLGRAMLYNAAMAAVTSKVWRPLYDQCLARGLKKVQALIVIARKIARTAWSLHKYGTTFHATRAYQLLT